VDLDTFIVATYCLVDEAMDESPPRGGGKRLRERGPNPTLDDDREVLTIEIVGEFLGIDTDEGIYRHFRRHYAGWFPALRTVHRTTPPSPGRPRTCGRPRSCSGAGCSPGSDTIRRSPWWTRSACRCARSPRPRAARASPESPPTATPAMSKGFFYGFRAHLRVCWPGVIVEATLAPANAHDRWVVESDLLSSPPPPETGEGGGWLLGDTDYSSPVLAEDLRRRRGVSLVAPSKTTKKRERHPWPRWLIAVRRRIETVGSQLVERYGVKRVRARDRWHLTSRFLRKVLSHTLCVLLCQREGLSPLRFSELVTH